MSVLQEFKSFALKGNVIDLAVAVVIGNAFSAIVSALVADLVMPIVGVVLPGGDWREYTVTPLNLRVGHLMGAILDFLVIAIVLFIVVVKVGGIWRKRAAGAAPPPPSTRICPECREVIPIEARRCKACTSVVAPVNA
ncbi:large conductance mechanosensitive channel protein MscL [Myxococcaceae bacterium GXIMD 01537]